MITAAPFVTTARAGSPVLENAAKDRIFADPSAAPGKSVLSEDDEHFLDDLERRGIQFFLDQSDPQTGLMADRSEADGGHKGVASIASVGFGLTAMCIGVERGWLPREDAYERSMRVLKFLRDKGPQEHGTFYHFLNMRTGEREWKCEVSNIDTALLMAGVITVRQYFPNTELATLANELYERVEWPWLLKDNGLLCMGWKPEEGMLKAEWADFSEGPPLILMLGMGSRTHPLPAKVWSAWRREPIERYAGLTYLQCPPLFTHQYPHCWFDYRGKRDDHADYFRNSQLATIAQRQWCIDDLGKEFPTYGPNVWGLTASDSVHGYTAWGGPPKAGDIDGSVVPAAAAGSLAFEPRLCLDALREMRSKFGEKGYLKYGFVDSFNPSIGWYNPDVIGIDVGPTVLMAENCRSGFVWRTFMSAPEATAAMKAAGFRATNDDDLKWTATTSLFGASADQRR
jgi:hypothetical protein